MSLPGVHFHGLGFNYCTYAYCYFQRVIDCSGENSHPKKRKENVRSNRIHFVLYSFSWDHIYHRLCGFLYEDLLKQEPVRHWSVRHDRIMAAQIEAQELKVKVYSRFKPMNKGGGGLTLWSKNTCKSAQKYTCWFHKVVMSFWSLCWPKLTSCWL